MASEVDDAIADQLPDLLATAIALTGAPETAADLVGEVMVLARRRRGGVDLADPGAGLRDQLVARSVARRPSRAAEPVMVEESGVVEELGVVEESGEPEEIDTIMRGLDRLSRPQRAALLLSIRDRLTYAEIATIIDRPVATVGPSVAKAQTQLGATPYAIAAAFAQFARTAPEPAEARAAAVRFARRLGVRRRRISAVVSAAVVVVALAVALPSVIVPRLFPVPVRTAGEWAYGYRLTPPPGFHVSQRFLERDLDSTYLVDDAGPSTGCAIEISVAQPTASLTPGGLAVKVRGRAGWIRESAETQGKSLTWMYAPQSVATVSCRNRADPEPLLRQLANGLTFTPVALPLPFRLSTLPAGFQVSAVGTSSELPVGSPQPTTGLLLAGVGPDENADGGIFLVMPSDEPEGDDLDHVVVNGTDAVVRISEGTISLCLTKQNVVACLSAVTEAAQADGKASEADVRRLVELAGTVSFAADLADRTTWFDAREALPH